MSPTTHSRTIIISEVNYGWIASIVTSDGSEERTFIAPTLNDMMVLIKEAAQ